MATDAKGHLESESARAGLWAAIVVVATIFGFVVGYAVSSRTGVEPGYFDAPEAGGYGVPAGSGPKISEELRKHYEGLTK